MKVLVIAAHPDDEVLGCGATIARHARQGDEVSITIMGTGALSREDSCAEDVSALGEQAQKAGKVLGAKSVRVLDLPDNRFDSLDRLAVIRKIEDELRRETPDVIYTHHAGDLNVDHRRTFEAVVTACRPQGKGKVSRVLSFEVPSSTEWQAPTGHVPFVPNVFVDVTETLQVKAEALKIYPEEMRSFPHPRSIDAVRALASWRGAMAGFGAAESFVLVRELLSEKS